MAALNGAVKVFIVQRLACYDKPLQVQKAVKQVFGLDVSLQQLTAYNPETIAGSRMSQTLKDVFDAARKAFLADTSGIAIAQRSYRLRALDRMATQLEESGNLMAAAELIEQAAKEAGGAFTNKQEVQHSGKVGVTHTLTDAQRASRLATLLTRAAQKAASAGQGKDGAAES